MKISTIVTIVIVAAALLFYLYIKGYIFANFESVDVMSAHRMIGSERNITILDVRTPEEYRRDGHLKNAVLIPVSLLEKEIGRLKRAKGGKVIVYCRSGSRSVMASRILAVHGFTPVNVKGGINAWKKAHLPLED